jgi:signal transduction histidine kinase
MTQRPDPTQDLLLRLSKDGVCVDVGGDDLGLLAVPHAAAVGRPLAELLPDAAPVLAPKIAAARATGRVQLVEVAVGTPPAPRRAALCRIARCGFSETLLILSDVTGEHPAPLPKVASLGLASASIAHEINNPLMVIDSTVFRLQALAKTAPNGEELEALSAKLAEMSGRVGAVVKGMRQFARDVPMPPLVDTDVRAELQMLVDLNQARAAQYDVSLTLGAIEPALSIRCRRDHFAQILFTLLENALDATRAAAERWIRLDARTVPGGVEIAVTDSGPGVPAALRERLMQPFFTTKQAGSGNGLGLTIAQGLLRQHLGSLSLDTESERTRFVVFLPERREASEQR